MSAARSERTSVDVYALVIECADSLSGGEVPALAAHDLFQKMAANHPEDLARMLHEHGPFLFTQIFRDRLRSTRSKGVSERAATQFGEAAAQFTAGDLSVGEFRGAFALPHRVGLSGAVKRAGEMTGADHLFVSERYNESAKTFKMRAALHAAIARKVGDRRTDEVYTETEYAALVGSCYPIVHNPKTKT